jgi:hypothetical protein
MSSIRSTGHFRRTHEQSSHVLMVGAAESAPYRGLRMSSIRSTDHFRRTHEQSSHVLMVGAAESAP